MPEATGSRSARWRGRGGPAARARERGAGQRAVADESDAQSLTASIKAAGEGAQERRKVVVCSRKRVVCRGTSGS